MACGAARWRQRTRSVSSKGESAHGAEGDDARGVKEEEATTGEVTKVVRKLPEGKRKLPEEELSEGKKGKHGMPWKEDWHEATPCRFFRMGRCTQGERCPFQHSEQERKPGDWWCKDPEI